MTMISLAPAGGEIQVLLAILIYPLSCWVSGGIQDAETSKF